MSSPGARSHLTRRRGRAAKPTLSKSKYLAGLQCELRVWQQVHEKELATPPDAATQARFDAGNELGHDPGPTDLHRLPNLGEIVRP